MSASSLAFPNAYVSQVSDPRKVIVREFKDDGITELLLFPEQASTLARIQQISDSEYSIRINMHIPTSDDSSPDLEDKDEDDDEEPSFSNILCFKGKFSGWNPDTPIICPDQFHVDIFDMKENSLLVEIKAPKSYDYLGIVIKLPLMEQSCYNKIPFAEHEELLKDVTELDEYAESDEVKKIKTKLELLTTISALNSSLYKLQDSLIKLQKRY